jgi:hypothetical protein
MLAWYCCMLKSTHNRRQTGRNTCSEQVVDMFLISDRMNPSCPSAPIATGSIIIYWTRCPHMKTQPDLKDTHFPIGHLSSTLLLLFSFIFFLYFYIFSRIPVPSFQPCLLLMILRKRFNRIYSEAYSLQRGSVS